MTIIMMPPPPPPRREIVKDGVRYREVLPGDDLTRKELVVGVPLVVCGCLVLVFLLMVSMMKVFFPLLDHVIRG